MKLTNKQIVGAGGPSMRLGKWYVNASKETGNRIRANSRLIRNSHRHGNDKTRQSPHVDYGLMDAQTVKFGDVVIRLGWQDTGRRIAYRTANNAIKG